MRHILFVPVILICLVGCAGRATVALVPEAATLGVQQAVFVGSTRGGAAGPLGDERSETLNYLSFDVHIPPDRREGEVDPVRDGEAAPPPDPEHQFMVTRADQYRDAPAFRTSLRRALAAPEAQGREVMIFVHGYNMTFADGLYRTAQIQHDLDLQGVAVHYAWPSAAHVLGYAHDRDSAQFARDGLESLIAEVRAAGGRDIVLVAHSMGANIVMEALRQIRIGGRDPLMNGISGVVLMSPDIDTDVFRSQAARIDPLPQPFVIFTSRRDRALRISARLNGEEQRLGNLGTVEDVADFDVTLIDISEFRGGQGDGLNHITAASSPAVVEILRQANAVNAAFEQDPAQQVGLLPGTALTVRNATQLILQPGVP